MAAIALVMENVDVLDVDEYEENLERRREQMRRKKDLRDVSDPFMIGDDNFKRLYRMTPALAIEFIELLLRPRLKAHTLGIQPHLQVLAVLRFLAEGGYQKGVANDYNHPMSQPTFSRYMHSVIPAINELADDYIKFPRDQEQRRQISDRFREKYNFPVNILGVVDCTLPRIHTPSDHEEAYLNHKRFHSLNVQVVSDADCNIINIRTTNGSTNDKFVWRFSDVRQNLIELRADENIQMNEGKYYFLADNGYNPSKILLTPVTNAPIDSPEYNYTLSVCRIRCVIEQLLGIWKEIMRCINGDRSLHYDPEFSAEIVLACATVYNFLRRRGMPMPVPPRVENDQEFYVYHEIDNEYLEGVAERNEVIRAHFV